MLYFILAAALVVLDQVVKLLVRSQIPLGEGIPFLPGLMDLTYVQNTGAAFSLFEKHTWILAVISAAVSALLVWALAKRLFKRPFGQITLAVVLAGAVGNLIDRVFLGFVTDMFETTFMNFAVFNVADICVVLGGIALCVYVLFFYGSAEKSKQKESSSHDADHTAG